MPMIPIDINISIPELWNTNMVFHKNQWDSINLLTGPNDSGKTLFSKRLAEQLKLKGYKVLSSNEINQSNDIFNLLKEQPNVKPIIEHVLQRKIPSVFSSIGEKYIISLLACVFSEQHNCIILDAPESYLHPTNLRSVITELKRVAGNPSEDSSKKIFFVITHSTDFININGLTNLENILVFQRHTPPTTVEMVDHLKSVLNFKALHNQIPNKNITTNKDELEKIILNVLTKIGFNQGALINKAQPYNTTAASKNNNSTTELLNFDDSNLDHYFFKDKIEEFKKIEQNMVEHDFLDNDGWNKKKSKRFLVALIYILKKLNFLKPKLPLKTEKTSLLEYRRFFEKRYNIDISQEMQPSKSKVANLRLYKIDYSFIPGIDNM